MVDVERGEVERVLLPLLELQDRRPLKGHRREIDVGARRRRDDRHPAIGAHLVLPRELHRARVELRRRGATADA